MSDGDEDPLREPEPERLTDLDRRLRERDRRMPWLRIVLLAAALVGVLVFHQTISEEMAGCYQHNYVGKPDASPEPGGIRIEPARQLTD